MATEDRSRLRKAVAALALAMALVLPASASALPPNQPDAGAWVPNAQVSDIVHHGNLTYLAGYFSWVGPWTGSLAAFGAEDGSARTSFPRVRGGYVYAAAPDTIGGTYIAGDFTSVGGVQTGPVAHVLANGSVDTTFKPPLINGRAYALAVGTSGGVTALFVGGEFNAAGNQPRGDTAAFEISLAPADNGKLLAWNAAASGGTFGVVYALATSLGSSGVFVGGDFSELGGANRDGLGKVNATTGNIVSTWTTGTDSGGEVHALALSPDEQTLYVGGTFAELGTSGSHALRNNLGAVGTADPGTPNGFDPGPNGQVNAITVDPGGSVFVGGFFDHIAGDARAGVARFDGGALSPFDAQLADKSSPAVHALALGGNPSRLFIGGTFTAVGGQGRHDLAAVNPTSGAPVPFSPAVGGEVDALAAPDSSTIVAGGRFVSVGGVPRAGLAAMDASGHPTAFAPVLTNGGADRIALSPNGATLYALSTSSFPLRTGAAAFSTSTGALLPWNAQLDNNQINSIAVDPSGKTVYLGGSFTSAGGAPRHDLAAVSASSGAATPWRPDPDQPVAAIAVSRDGSTVYVGGSFTSIGPSVLSRPHLAALSAANAEPSSWDPAPDNGVTDLALAPDGSGLYVTGQFTHIGSPSVARASLADVSLATGGASGLVAPPFQSPGYVFRVTPGGDPGTVFVSGFFSSVGGIGRPGLAGFGPTGSLLSWSPSLQPGTASAMAQFDGDTAWLAGYFSDSPNGHPFYLQFSTLPVATSAPKILGTPRTGHGAVSCRAAVWQNAPGSITTAWLLDGKPILGASAATFKPAANQSGHKLACAQTAANAAGATTASSPAVRIKDGIAPTLRVKPAAHHARGLIVTVSEAARLTITVTGKRHRKLGVLHANVKAGKHTIRLPHRIRSHALVAGNYTLKVIAIDRAGNRSRAITVHLSAR
jgi:hypothetical protein